MMRRRKGDVTVSTGARLPDHIILHQECQGSFWTLKVFPEETSTVPTEVHGSHHEQVEQLHG